jgi:hypothetical protein
MHAAGQWYTQRQRRQRQAYRLPSCLVSRALSYTGSPCNFPVPFSPDCPQWHVLSCRADYSPRKVQPTLLLRSLAWLLGLTATAGIGRAGSGYLQSRCLPPSTYSLVNSALPTADMPCPTCQLWPVGGIRMRCGTLYILPLVTTENTDEGDERQGFSTMDTKAVSNCLAAEHDKSILPPYNIQEWQREVRMRSRVLGWMAQRVRDRSRHLRTQAERIRNRQSANHRCSSSIC